MKKSKKILICVGVFLLLLLITWGICETAGSDYYNYQGYVLDMKEDNNGNTVIVTLCGNKESNFTLKWYSRVKLAEDKKNFAVGDLVKLSTTRFSDTNIKKIFVDYGYSTEGKLVYVKEFTDRPYILATDPKTNIMYFFDFNIDNDIQNFEGIKTGDTVRIYHQYPISNNTISALGNAVKLISDSSTNGLTEEELKFIEEKGYTLK
ncbi:MAG: hypothetical protein IJ011_01390 [Clostridia bacterium]|nr:hypothetical protein [Clostridia bacterium]